MKPVNFVQIAEDLELAGLYWKPEIGDEIADRKGPQKVSILVDPQGMSPSELRNIYLWLPTVEQIVQQFEARQVVLCHTGLELSESAMAYRTILQTSAGQIESQGDSMRTSMAMALRALLLASCPCVVN